MTAHEIISRVRRKGDVRLGPGDRIQIRKCPHELRVLIRQNELAIRYFLKEERASRRWEESGRDPRWWEMYDGSRRAVNEEQPKRGL